MVTGTAARAAPTRAAAPAAPRPGTTVRLGGPRTPPRAPSGSRPRPPRPTPLPGPPPQAPAALGGAPPRAGRAGPTCGDEGGGAQQQEQRREEPRGAAGRGAAVLGATRHLGHLLRSAAPAPSDRARR